MGVPPGGAMRPLTHFRYLSLPSHSRSLTLSQYLTVCFMWHDYYSMGEQVPSLCVCPIDKINVIRSGVGWTWWQRPGGIFGGSRQTGTQNSDAKEIFRTRICVAMEKMEGIRAVLYVLSTSSKYLWKNLTRRWSIHCWCRSRNGLVSGVALQHLSSGVGHIILMFS